MTSVDVERLYNDLINALNITFRGSSKIGLAVAVLEDIYNAYQEKNYNRIVEWAIQEGFNLEDYYV
jgi:hypothetical protein